MCQLTWVHACGNLPSFGKGNVEEEEEEEPETKQVVAMATYHLTS